MELHKRRKEKFFQLMKGKKDLPLANGLLYQLIL